MNYGYIRSHKGNPPFLDKILKAGVLPENILEDDGIEASPSLDALIARLQKGDLLFVESITHFATHEKADTIRPIIEALMEREVVIHFIDSSPYSMTIDSEEMFQATLKALDIIMDFKHTARLEMNEAISLGMQRAKEMGKPIGRKPQPLTPQQKGILRELSKGARVSDIAREHGVSRTAIYKLKQKGKKG